MHQAALAYVAGEPVIVEVDQASVNQRFWAIVAANWATTTAIQRQPASAFSAPGWLLASSYRDTPRATQHHLGGRERSPPG